MTRWSIRKRLFTPPEDILAGHLTTGESFLLVDEPSNNAFIVAATNEILIIIGVAFLTLVMIANGAGAVTAIFGFLVVDILVLPLVWRRLQAFYTRYALTDFRVMRSWGVFNRHMTWIPWSKVTDVSISQSLSGRMFGYATVRIESANEASGFKEIKDLRNPRRFHRYIATIVEAKQGKISSASVQQMVQADAGATS